MLHTIYGVGACTWLLCILASRCTHALSPAGGEEMGKNIQRDLLLGRSRVLITVCATVWGVAAMGHGDATLIICL